MSNTGDIKIGDFGLSTIMRNQLQTSVLGTPEYMAPEIYEGSYDTKVDVFSFGMCVLEMCTLSPPYRECQSQASIYKKVLNRILPESIQTIQNEDVRSFIGVCLELAHKRPTVDELLQHRFLIIDDKDQTNHQPVLLIKSVDPCTTHNHAVLSPRSTDLSEHESTQIESSLIIKDNRGALRHIAFNFDLASDTPEKVAEEMVHELDLDPALVIPIANEIEMLVFSNSHYKQASIYSKSYIEDLIDFSSYEEHSQESPRNQDRAPILSTRKVSITSHLEAVQTEEVKHNEFNLEDLVISEETIASVISNRTSNPQSQLALEDEFSSLEILSLKRGSPDNNKDVVKQLQQALSEVLKSRVKIDGFFGKKVESLIKEFQEAHGIEPDGLICEDLWNNLMSEYDKSKAEDTASNE